MTHLDADIACAHHVIAVGELRLLNFHQRMTPRCQQAIADFWLAMGAIADPREAHRRAHEVVYLAVNADGAIVGVSTCYVDSLELESARGNYWHYRQFVAPAYRTPQLAGAIVNSTLNYLRDLSATTTTVKGVVIALENKKLQSPSLTQRVFKNHFKLNKLGVDAQGRPLWGVDFEPSPAA